MHRQKWIFSGFATGEDTEVKALAESIAKDLRDKAADSEVKTSAVTRYEMPANMLIPRTTAKVKSPLRIMCGALNSSYKDIFKYTEGYRYGYT